MEQQNVFASRSLCVIEDFSIEERLYLFEQVKILKTAMENHDAQRSIGIGSMTRISGSMRSSSRIAREPRSPSAMRLISIMQRSAN